MLGGGVSPALLREPEPGYATRVAAELDLPESYLLSLATLEPRKGLDVLVDALAALRDAAPTLLVVGQPGWGGVDVASVARERGVEPDRIRVLGHIDDSQLAVVLRRATLLVAPSRAEGFGLPVAEAMAVGTAVVCSDAPALVEVAAGAARIVPRGDSASLAEALATLLHDADARQRMVAAGLAQAPRHDWDEVARRAWRLYRGLIG